MTPKTDIRRAATTDIDGIFAMMRRAAAEPIGLARRPEEIARDYVEAFVTGSLAHGLIMVAEQDRRILGMIQAKTPPPRLFAHVLSDLTIAIDPDAQGQGLGRRLFTAFLDTARADMPHIRRVELFCRPDNPRGYPFYESLGFVIEGRLKGRVRTADGAFIDDYFMGLQLRG
jgi:putative acetyltransferase